MDWSNRNLFLLVGSIIIVLMFYLFLVKPFQYWKRLHIPQQNVYQIYKNLFATVLGRKSFTDANSSPYQDFPRQRYFGLYPFGTPTLCIRDPQLIMQITVEDFDYFTDCSQLSFEKTKPIWVKNLIGLTGKKWKYLRTIFNGYFSSSKLKTIYPILYDYTEQFTEALGSNNTDADVVEVDLKDAFKNYGCNGTIFSQGFSSFFEGFESLSLAMSFTLYQLAVNQQKQKILISEVRENVKNFGTCCSYENLLKMNYLDMVISESLRMSSIVPFSDRVCTKPYTIQREYTDENTVHLTENDQVVFDIAGLHNDPKYFPHPDRFDPERFSNENKDSIVAGSYMPFGLGHRSCLGNILVVIVLKLVIYHTLLKYQLVVIDKTLLPLSQTKRNIRVNIKNSFWVGLKKRNV